MNLANILTITKKELRSYFDSPTAYIVLVIFLFLWQYLFFRDVFLLGETSLRSLFSFLPWLLLILIPALTMGTIASEKSQGTLELLLTHPLGFMELILGKFLGTLIFVALALAFVFPLAYSFDRFGNLDWGVVLGQYLGALFLASVLISLGIFVSSLVASQISALLIAAATSFFLIIAGFEMVTLTLPASLALIFERLSVLSHFEAVSRGVIDIRDLVYFFSVTFVFLFFSFLQLVKIRLGNRPDQFRRFLFTAGLLLILVVSLNIVGDRIPGRLDLTQDQVYRLTQTTTDTLNQLDDIVQIKLFASSQLPPQLRPVLREIKDVLRDYQTQSQGKINLSFLDPANPQTQEEASQLGIREVQFNVIGQEELQVKRGYLGLAVSYAGNSEVIPFITDTSDLEYQLTSFIVKLTNPQKPQVAFLTGHGEKSRLTNYSAFNSQLERLFEVTDFSFTGEPEADTQPEPQPVPEAITSLIVAGPREPLSSQEQLLLSQYLDSGGALLLLLDSVVVNQSLLSASLNEATLDEFLQNYGLTLNKDLVYDVRSSEVVNFGSPDGGSFVVRYPFWPRLLATDKTSPIVSRIDNILTPWTGSLSLNQDQITNRGLESKILFSTSNYAGTQVGTFDIAPNSEVSTGNLSQHPIAVSLLSQAEDTATRLIVVADSDFLNDEFIASSPQNLAFGLESISWLSQSQSLAEIQLKQRQPRPLIFEDASQPQLIKYANLGLTLILPVVIGLTRLMRRRKLATLTYS